MNKSLIALLLGSLTLAACASTEPKEKPLPIPVEDEFPTESSAGNTTLEVAYIALNDNGANGPLVGCGDSEVLVELTAEGDLNSKERIKAALEKLFADKEQNKESSGLYNAVYQSSLTVDEVTVSKSEVNVTLSGETILGGECDDPRFVDQIKATVQNNLDQDFPGTIHITINGKDLEKIQDLSGN